MWCYMCLDAIPDRAVASAIVLTLADLATGRAVQQGCEGRHLLASAVDAAAATRVGFWGSRL